MKDPDVSFSVLPAADGSATFVHTGYSVLASINGPLEAQRRDEIPDQAHLEVNVREASGIGGPRERLLETLLHRTICPLILTTAYPRTLIQLTLQVMRSPDHVVTTAPLAQSSQPLLVLPHLVNAAVCALLDSGIAMTAVAVALGLEAQSDGTLSQTSEMQGGPGASLHVFAFDGARKLLLAETEGAISHDTWRKVVQTARTRCCGHDGEAEAGLLGWLRQQMARHLGSKGRWRAL